MNKPLLFSLMFLAGIVQAEEKSKLLIQKKPVYEKQGITIECFPYFPNSWATDQNGLHWYSYDGKPLSDWIDICLASNGGVYWRIHNDKDFLGDSAEPKKSSGDKPK